MGYFIKLFAVYVCLTFTACWYTVLSASVSSITPRQGSLEGATRITIYGSGFAESQFNFFNSLLGNNVTLVSNTRSYPCDVHKDGSTQTQIMCYTRPMPSDFYYVRVAVDGIEIPDNNYCGGKPFSTLCRFEAKSRNTPTITSVSPRSLAPGGIVTIRGRIFSDMFGSNLVSSTNGRNIHILRAYVGGNECQLKDFETGEFYGLDLDNENSDYGTMKCKLLGTQIGGMNATFLLDGYLGRSQAGLNVKHVNWAGDIEMTQTYAEIQSVDPATGSVEGGTLLTISGKNFDNSLAAPVVEVGGTRCKVLSLTIDKITCEVQPKGLTLSKYPGNRGVVRETKNSTLLSFNDLEKFGNETEYPAESISSREWHGALFSCEGGSCSGSDHNNFVSRFKTFFVPSWSGEYQFYILADDEAKLYVTTVGTPDNKTLVAQCSSWRNDYNSAEQKSARLNLERGKRYYLEVVHQEKTNVAKVKVAVKFFDTDFLPSQTAEAHVEMQKLVLTSTVTPEIQTIKLVNLTSHAAVDEVQVVNVVTTDPASSTFRLGLGGVYTEPLTVDASAADLQGALNNLAGFPDSSFVVTSASSLSGGKSYTVKVVNLGDVPELSSLVVGNITVMVTSQTHGKSSLDTVTLTLAGKSSIPIDVNADQSKMEAGVKSIFQPRCPKFITKPKSSVTSFYEDFEPTGGTHYIYGLHTLHKDSFCGVGAVSNPQYIFKSKPYAMNLNFDGKQICFAYLSDKPVNLKLVMKKDKKNHDIRIPLAFNANRWTYVCKDMLSEAQKKISETTTNYVLVNAGVHGANVLVDEVFIGKAVTTQDSQASNLWRIPSNPGPMKTVTVTKEAVGVYNITLTPFDCNHGYPLFSLQYGQAISGSDSSDSLTVKDKTWPNWSYVAVSRVESASPPVNGSFDVQFDGNAYAGIPVTSTAWDLTNYLESLPRLGKVQVTDSATCHSHTWTVKWQLPGGNRPRIQVNATALTGRSVQMKVQETDGYLFLDPIQGDFLRTSHDKPQVTAVINGIPSKCSGSCTYEWTQASTPVISSISPNSGSTLLNTALTISGSGFDNKPENIHVAIGGVNCTVQSATTNQIVCSIGNGPTGSHRVHVKISGKGLAKHQGAEHSFSYKSDVTGIEPMSGSLGGGTTLTINGTGFAANDTVMVGSQACVIETVTYLQIKCLTPATTTADEVSVVVHQGSGEVVSPANFTYTSALTPVISSASLSVSSVLGGDDIEITGTNLGSLGATKLLLGGATVNITSANSSHVLGTLPPNTPGTYKIALKVDEMGYADITTNNIAPVSYTLRVDSFEPRRGSLEGGTKITVKGAGFGDDSSKLRVLIGGRVCDVVNSSFTTIVCLNKPVSRVHQVDNMGIHTAYGVGYAWNPGHLEIRAGDTVHWRWDAPFLIKSVKYSVQQTAGPQAGGYDGSGFKSLRTKKGSFAYTFITPGTYYYFSDKVDNAGKIVMRGVIQVKPRQSVFSDVSVKLGSFEAQYQPSVNVSSTIISAINTSIVVTNCSTVITNGSCPGDTVTQSAAAIQFSQLSCITPVINSVSPNTGTVNTSITIVGTGFGESTCQNEVRFGQYQCTVMSASSTMIVCHINPQGGMPVGQAELVSVRVHNVGYAITTIQQRLDRAYILLPQVSTIYPRSGSLEGGLLLTVTGTGLSAPDRVSIGGIDCIVKSSTYREVVCVTQPSYETVGQTIVEVVANGNRLRSNNCSTSCEFAYSQLATPDVTSISTNQISGASSQITFSGERLNGTAEDGITVSLGGQRCSVVSVTSTQLTCTIGYVVVGNQPLSIRYNRQGNAKLSAKTMEVLPSIDSISHVAGSQQGGLLLTVVGGGFTASSSSVTIGDKPCVIKSLNLSEIHCVTPAGNAQLSVVQVVSNSVKFPSATFNFLDSETPELTSVSPVSGNIGDTITISGAKLSGNPSDVTVRIGDAQCNVSSSTTSTISCNLGDSPSGSYPITVHVAGKGNGRSSLSFKYNLEITNVSPKEGSFGGGQVLTMTGSGFSANASVTVCDQPCGTTTTSGTSIQCKTPPHLFNANSTTQDCDIVVTVKGKTVSGKTKYVYKAGLTPVVSSINPKRGGTMGGTSVTIKGSGFSSIQAENTVDIAGSPCVVSASSATEIVCVTEKRRLSVRANVVVTVASRGGSPKTADTEFLYIDRWSSVFTWGGQSVPSAGDLVVIPKGEVILLDNSTEILKVLIIEGSLIFDEVDVQLNAEIILVNKGGLLQVGTVSEPFQHKATIMLHGHVRSKEMPIYGTKVLAVREGRLELHGKPVVTSWTRLSDTASSRSSTLKLQVPVKWQVGDEIVIATTGHRHSQRENEKRKITAISNDGRTVTVDSPLDYTHLGVTETYAQGISLDKRAEVGLLTHNVVVRGSRDLQWAEDIPACKKGFNTGQFATQTCFQGRFGAEMGSDMFGGHIIVHAPQKSKQLAVAHIEYVELTYVGQAFRLGRYPIHFHLNGDLSGSYVRGCAIHWSFNRAVNIHNTHNVLIERNVVYNIMGGALFLEDGIETGNVFQYNLAVFVRDSTSLLNDDLTPAAFWATNPDNVFRHNAAAGGSHFGFWFRMHNHPDGPSFTKSICPRKVLIREFYNNTVHSQGWFGLWFFKAYFPMKTGQCSSNTPEPAVFRRLIAWNCEKGAEWTDGGAIQFHDFLLVANSVSGVEIHGISQAGDTKYTDRGPLVKDTIIVSRDGTGSTATGIALPPSKGLKVKNTTFVNFYSSSVGVQLSGAPSRSAAFDAVFEQITFINSPNRGASHWEHEVELLDMDGTLTGHEGHRIIPSSDLLPPSCVNVSFTFRDSMRCPPEVRFIRMGLNKAKPSVLTYKNFLVENTYGTSSLPWGKKRITHKKGYEAKLPIGLTYSMKFENVRTLSNMSYSAEFDDLTPSDYIIIEQPLAEMPDRVSVSGGNRQMSPMPLSNENVHGDWFYDAGKQRFSYIVSGRTSRSKRAVSRPTTLARTLSVSTTRCFYKDCIVPPSPKEVPPARATPANPYYWSDVSIWPDKRLPVDGDDVVIPEDKWVIADVDFPVMKSLTIHGGLELTSTKNVTRNYTLETTYLIIIGGRLVVGWEDKPFTGRARIVLSGTANTEAYAGRGTPVGSKVIASFGGLDLHGQNRYPYWTRLSKTVNAGDNSIHLQAEVDWTIGEEISLASTSYSAWETETFTIRGVSSDRRQLTLNSTVMYRHIGGGEYGMAAEVGLLTRNIRVEGKPYSKMEVESYGARLVVGVLIDKEGTQHTGYARIQNIQFFNTGQEGFKEEYDPRYSVAFVGTGTSTPLKPSFVKYCSFHNGFSPAIGLYGANNLTVAGNVVHHTVGGALIISGDGNKIYNNLAMLDIWPGAYLNRTETANVDFPAAIDAYKATNVELVGNVVAGAERVGYNIKPGSCNKADESVVGNVAHSCMMGIGYIGSEGTGCLKISEIFIYKAMFFGIYMQTADSVRIENVTLVDNQVGVLAMIVGPAALSHKMASKTVTVADSLIVGTSSEFSCSADKKPSDDNTVFGAKAKSWGSGRIGVGFSSFMSGGNGAPEKSWKGVMSYPAIGGATYIDGVTFAKFGTRCGRDVAISTNPSSDDAQHPVYASNIQWKDTPLDSRILFHTPNLGKINPSDCVDMDCDALKKALVRDIDGTLLGTPGGAVLPKSEFQWGGDKRRGLGNYRIPYAMLTTVEGVRLDADTKFPHKGLFRGTPSSCTWNSVWNAYRCANLDHQMMIIESLDKDTETRRLSPVALATEGYVDLINGPQDHGWCGHYTCHKRISTFYSLVAMNYNYTMFFTSTNPKKLRLRLLNVNINQGITISIWYADPRRLDIYYDGQYIFPMNSRLTAKGSHGYKAPTYDGEFVPSVNSLPGSNFFDRRTGIIHITVKGPKHLDIITKDVIILNWSLPPITVDDFFGDNLVANLAAFFDIPPSKIRIVNVVQETKTRRRRSIQTTSVQVEIGDEPSSAHHYNDTVAGSLSHEQLVNLSSSIVSAQQLGKLDPVLNSTVLGLTVLEPLPDTGSDQWKQAAKNPSSSSLQYSVQVPKTMELYADVQGQQEGSPFFSQPKLRMLDSAGELVKVLGSLSSPWELQAELRTGPSSDPRAILVGKSKIPFKDGWANFTDLAISHSGGDYSIYFSVIYSSETEKMFNKISSKVTLEPQQLKAGVVNQTHSIEAGQPIEVTVQIQDYLTGTVHHNITWKDHTWNCQVSLYMPGLYKSTAVISGTVEVTFNVTTSEAYFTDLSINVGPARYFFQFDVKSLPPTYFFTTLSGAIDVWPSGHTSVKTDVKKQVELKFDANYDTAVKGKEPYFSALIYNTYMSKYKDIVLSNFALAPGSIVVKFDVAGNDVGVETFLNGIANDVNSSMSLEFNKGNITAVKLMKVDGVYYKGLDGNVVPPPELAPPLSTGAIIGIVVVCILVLVGAVLLVSLVLHRKLKKENENKIVSVANAIGSEAAAQDFSTKLIRQVKVFAFEDGNYASYDYPPSKKGNKHISHPSAPGKSIEASESTLTSATTSSCHSEDEKHPIFDLSKTEQSQVKVAVLQFPGKIKSPVMPVQKTMPIYNDFDDLHVSVKSSLNADTISNGTQPRPSIDESVSPVVHADVDKNLGNDEDESSFRVVQLLPPPNEPCNVAVQSGTVTASEEQDLPLPGTPEIPFTDPVDSKLKSSDFPAILETPELPGRKKHIMSSKQDKTVGKKKKTGKSDFVYSMD